MSNNNLTDKQKKQRNRHLFLLDYFFPDDTDSYKAKELGNWVLVKFFNASINEWEVAVYTKESYEQSLVYRQKFLV